MDDHVRGRTPNSVVQLTQVEKIRGETATRDTAGQFMTGNPVDFVPAHRLSGSCNPQKSGYPGYEKTLACGRRHTLSTQNEGASYRVCSSRSLTDVQDGR